MGERKSFGRRRRRRGKREIVMADDLFEGLPAPSSNTAISQHHQLQPRPIAVATNNHDNTESSAVPAPKPILKSALKQSSAVPPPKSILKSSLKRPNPTQPDTQGQLLFLSITLFFSTCSSN